MASRKECDPRAWRTFWSTIVVRGKQKDRYRHQVRITQQRMGKGPKAAEPPKWMVRTEIYLGSQPIYHSVSTDIPEAVGKYLCTLVHAWGNVNEEGGPMFPPAFPEGFLQMAAAVDFQPPGVSDDAAGTNTQLDNSHVLSHPPVQQAGC